MGSVAVALTVVAVAIAFLDAPHAGRAALWGVAAGVTLCWAVASLASLAKGLRLGAVTGLFALCASAAIAAMRVGDHHGLGASRTPREIAEVAALLAMALGVHLLLSLPDGRLVTRARQVQAGVWYAVALIAGVFLVASPRALSVWPVAVAWTVALASTAPTLRSRYAAAPARGRQCLQSLAAGATITVTLAVAFLTLHSLVDWPIDFAPALLASTCLVPLGLAFGCTRSSSIADRVLIHLLTTLGTVAIVAGAYLIAVRGFDRAPTSRTARELLCWAMAAAAVAAVAQLALRGRFGRIATSFTYGAREAPDEVVRSFGSRMTRAIPMDELLLQLVESLRKTLSLASAEIYTGNSELLELVVSVPDIPSRSVAVTREERSVVARAGVSGNAWASVWLPAVAMSHKGPMRIAPISHAGELLGIIVVSRAEGAVAFREDDDRVLSDLARQVGLALHNAQLDTALQSSLDELRRQADELRASRARVVASGDAERRRVERNLHDGAQQHLVALAVNLRLAKDVVTEDPEAAVTMLDELGAAVQETIQEIRELAHGIYPPLLVDSGLTEALRAVANRSPLDVQLVTEGIGRYGGDVEAAVYFCCLEALQNAGKHAPDARVVVRIWEESGGLLFEVRDDGPGFDLRLAQRGHGYVNMMDRLGAIGGAVRWESEIGVGTAVRGSVPIKG